MDGGKKQRLFELCEAAANEQNAQRLLKLIQEINRLLEDQERQLKDQRKPEKT